MASFSTETIYACCQKSIGRRDEPVKCSTCIDKFHERCILPSSGNAMSEEDKKYWVCPSCVSKKPREAKNDSTPVRRKIETIPTMVVADSELGAPTGVSEDNLRRIIKQELSEAYGSMIRDLVDSVRKLETANEQLLQLVRDLSKPSQLHQTDATGANTKLDARTQQKRGRPKTAAAALKMPPPPTGKKETVTTEQLNKTPPTVECPIMEKVLPKDPEVISVGPVLTQHHSHDDSSSEGEWKTVTKRRRSMNVLKGTAAPGTTLLEAAERKSFLHLYFVKTGTSADVISEHLKTICPTDSCSVEVLKPRGDYASFKLGVPAKNVSLYMSVEHWAEDVHIKEWQTGFRKQRSGTKREQAPVQSK